MRWEVVLTKLIDLALISSLIAFGPVPAGAQSRFSHSDQARELINYANGIVFDRVSNDTEIDVSYSIEVVTGSNMPVASVDTSTGTILVPTQLVLLLFYFSDITAANYASGGEFVSCHLDYMNYVRRTVQRISKEEYEHRSSPYVSSPEEYAARGGPCQNISNFVPIPNSQRVARDQQVVNAIGLIILHEIGHLQLGHRPIVNEGDRSSFSSWMTHYCRSRSQEISADRFAVEKLYQYGWAEAVYQTPIWNFLAATFMLPAELSNHSTHPLPADRASDAFEWTLELYDQSGQTIPIQLRTQLEEVIATNRRIEAELTDLWQSTKLPIGC